MRWRSRSAYRSCVPSHFTEPRLKTAGRHTSLAEASSKCAMQGRRQRGRGEQHETYVQSLSSHRAHHLPFEHGFKRFGVAAPHLLTPLRLVNPRTCAARTQARRAEPSIMAGCSQLCAGSLTRRNVACAARCAASRCTPSRICLPACTRRLCRISVPWPVILSDVGRRRALLCMGALGSRGLGG